MARYLACDVEALFRGLLLGLALTGLSMTAPAEAANDDAADEDSELASLLALLDEETTIATRTRVNRDFVPGMVTVLRGDALRALGARHVLDALSLVPGFQVLREANGSGNLSVRGITVPFNAGNTKVLLDSVGLSREESGGNSAVLLLPIERVERIEIMRGPGSSIHGGFAFAGVINVITHKQGAQVFVSGDSDSAVAAGGHIAWGRDAGNWQGYVGGALADHGEDAGPIGQHPNDEVSWATLGLQRNAFSLTLHHTDRDQYLAPVPGIRLPSGEQSTAIEARQAFQLGPRADLEARVAWLENAFASATTGKRFSGSRIEGEVDLFWRPLDAHQVLLRMEAAQSRTDLGIIRLPAAPDPALLETSVRDQQRQLLAFTIQDQIELSETVSATLGLRWDDYDDVQSQFSPRLGLVWQAAERHILKAQYAEGFRAPTYWELYPRSERDERIGFETMGSAELGYVYRRPGATARVTLFRSSTDDQIYVVLPPPPGQPTQFDNSNRYRSRGVELEWEQNIGADFDLLANLSYADTWDSRSTSGPDGDSAVAADWIGNLAAIWRPRAGLSLALRWLYVDDRHAFSGELDGYDKLDLTLGWRRPASNWEVELGVRNALDDPIDYPFALPFSTVSQHFAPRTWWLRLHWHIPG
ncbi:TonB-dependent receptor plug domain-containing protein [Pseudomarimonas arenosa]|uniref:TonB-dependent receptor n=1 Tax=Pseudomarimonas arenosa TaxID=2774145 RepID=A0AAW3ZJJ3_9GAMM|nr:TonB-dependent receptor [Pseudomarimonas arenosa]MBD8524466.1 TonB-dependent receptor [Pseudomarimonas arenosa]